MSIFLIATLVVVGCDLLIAGAIPAVRFLFKKENVAATFAATPTTSTKIGATSSVKKVATKATATSHKKGVLAEAEVTEVDTQKITIKETTAEAQTQKLVAEVAAVEVQAWRHVTEATITSARRARKPSVEVQVQKLVAAAATTEAHTRESAAVEFNANKKDLKKDKNNAYV